MQISKAFSFAVAFETCFIRHPSHGITSEASHIPHRSMTDDRPALLLLAGGLNYFTTMPLISHSRLIILALWVLLQKADSVVGWSSSELSAARRLFGTRCKKSENLGNSRLFMSSSSSSNDHDSIKKEEKESTFIVEDEDCFDLCDIDWDVMPTDEGEEARGSNDSAAEPETTTKAAAATTTQTEKAPVDPGTMRVRLEMQWKARENTDECDIVELDSCGEFCQECAGRGTVQCRFCHGATKIPMGSKMMDCPVCNQLGHEPCKACKGSGRIAGWTDLLDYTTNR
jgi:hypothetical protein